MESQKNAVVRLVTQKLGTSFVQGKDNALSLLSNVQLEEIKREIAQLISSGQVAYSKDATNTSEVTSYSRSMVMNHLKKAKELNGGSTYTPASSRSTTTVTTTADVPSVVPAMKKKYPSGVTPEVLSEEMIALFEELA